MFSIPGLAITEHLEKKFYVIENSHTISIQSAITAISFSGYCPIIAQTRMNGKICFTVVPYKKPVEFDLSLIKEEVFSEEQITKMLVEQIRKKIENPLNFTPQLIAQYKLEMIQSCTRPSALAVDFLGIDYPIGKMIDIGCGIGSNSKLFLKKNWKVLGLDASSDAIATCERTLAPLYPTFSLMHTNITEITLDSDSFDVALAVDVLPYIPSSELLTTLRKIQSCLKHGGIFIGTIFFEKTQVKYPVLKVMQTLGATFYPDPTMTKSLLEHTGFIPEKIVIRDGLTDEEIIAVEFLAKKA